MLIDIDDQPRTVDAKKGDVIDILCRDILCVAKDETSVDIMRRGFCCNFLRKKSIMTNLAGETIDARCVDCIYIFIYTYICIIDSGIQRRETRSR
jgi:hypothetical protein